MPCSPEIEPPYIGADLEDLAARLDHARDFSRLAGIVEDVRMEVAVAGMEHVAHPELVSATISFTRRKTSGRRVRE